MCSTSAIVSGSKMMISSMRLRNSGRKVLLQRASRSCRWSASALRRRRRWRRKPSAAALAHELGAEVAGHDDDRVAEVHRAALAVGQAAVVQDLQQRVPDVRVRLLDLVEQDHAVRAAADRFGQLAAFFVADVAGRRAEQAADGVPLAVLAHVDAHQRVLVVEHELGQRLRQLGLADAGGPRKMNEPIGRRGSFRPLRARRMASAIACDGRVLADDALVQALFHVQQLLGSRSPACWLTGMPVHCATTSAMSLCVHHLVELVLALPLHRASR